MPHSSAMHLVSAIPGPLVKELDGGIWWGGRDEVVMVGHLVHICEAGRGMGLKNPKLRVMYWISTGPGPTTKEVMCRCGGWVWIR